MLSVLVTHRARDPPLCAAVHVCQLVE